MSSSSLSCELFKLPSSQADCKSLREKPRRLRRRVPNPRERAPVAILGPASLGEFATLKKGERRTNVKERRAWVKLKDPAQYGAIHPPCIPFKARRSARPNLPRHMRNVI